MSVVIMDVKMFDVPKEGPTLGQGEDVEMMEVLEEEYLYDKLDLVSLKLYNK